MQNPRNLLSPSSSSSRSAMQQGDYSSVPYYPYPPHPQSPNPSPNPNPNNSNSDHSSYASAPPYSSGYASSDYSNYPQAYQNSYPQNPDSSLQTFNSASQSPSFPPFESHSVYQAPPPPPGQQHQPYYPPYDKHQTAPSYSPPPQNPSPTAAYSAPYGQHPSASVPPVYDAPYDSYTAKYDQTGGYFDDGYGRSDSGLDLYGKQRYDSGRRDDGGGSGYGDGIYAYQGGSKAEPYGARGTAPKSSSSTLFDDYGRSVSFSSGKDSSSMGSSKIVRAVPKVESQQDSKGGVQKFRVKLLAESGGQSTVDVLCQIGLDGIRMLEPSNSRILRIYPLENITRCEKMDSSTLAVWSKSSVDIEPRRIRLQSNSYTTNTLLDTVTAASVQVKEMGGSSRPSDSYKTIEQPSEKKKGLADWMNRIKPVNEEKDHWVPDEAVTRCTGCGSDFGAFNRKHHCRNCGDIFCDKCTQGRTALTSEANAPVVRVCDRCLAEVAQRLSNAKEAANKPTVQSHEDLAKKIQEEMERNRKSSSASRSDGLGRRMREVACPVCTVHLQVQVPASGSETIECGVCQSPFLVSAH